MVISRMPYPISMWVALCFLHISVTILLIPYRPPCPMATIFKFSLSSLIYTWSQGYPHIFISVPTFKSAHMDAFLFVHRFVSTPNENIALVNFNSLLSCFYNTRQQ